MRLIQARFLSDSEKSGAILVPQQCAKNRESRHEDDTRSDMQKRASRPEWAIRAYTNGIRILETDGSIPGASTTKDALDGYLRGFDALAVRWCR